MEVTPADRSDVDRLVDLWMSLADDQREYESHLLSHGNEQRIRESMIRHVLEESLLVAEDGGIVGFAMFSIETGGYAQDCRRGLIENLYVRPEHRGQGIGAALLERAEGLLRENDVDRLTLEVMAANDDARRFYREHGYRPHRVELEKPVDDG